MSIPKSSDFITESCDYARMTDIWLSASMSAHDFIGPEHWRANAANMRDLYLPSARNFAYTLSGDILGFISLTEQGHIHALFVLPEYQGKGIGRLLLEYAASLHDTMTLTVYEENTRAVGFYRAKGFMVTERRMDHATWHPELLMIRIVR